MYEVANILHKLSKCKDINCCSRARSSYFRVILERFLPPPLPLVQGENGLEIADRNGDTSTHKIPSLFVRRSIQVEEMLPRSGMVFKIMPYDLFCPSVQSSLVDRVCKICHLYFASLVMLQQHASQLKQVVVPTKKVRPLRVAARRQRELMVVIAREENGKSVKTGWRKRT